MRKWIRLLYLSETLKNSHSDSGRSSNFQQFKRSILQVIASLKLLLKIVIFFTKCKGIVFFCVVLGVVTKLPQTAFLNGPKQKKGYGKSGEPCTFCVGYGPVQ